MSKQHVYNYFITYQWATSDGTEAYGNLYLEVKTKKSKVPMSVVLDGAVNKASGAILLLKGIHADPREIVIINVIPLDADECIL